MVEAFARVGGPLQAALGVITAASPQVAAAVGAGGGASAFNVLSGAALSFLGWKGSESVLRSGSQVLGAVNLLVGVLGLLGMDRVAGVSLNGTILANAINVGIGIWGLMTGLMARK